MFQPVASIPSLTIDSSLSFWLSILYSYQAALAYQHFNGQLAITNGLTGSKWVRAAGSDGGHLTIKPNQQRI